MLELLDYRRRVTEMFQIFLSLLEIPVGEMTWQM